MWMVPAPDPEVVPPDPTRWGDREWGEPYPCLQHRLDKSHPCSGKMMPARRCRRYDDVLWRAYTCNRCGRVAHDTKEPPVGWLSPRQAEPSPAARP